VTFEQARARFPVLERFAYLNAGTNGPLSRATVEAMTTHMRADLEDGRGGRAYFERLLAIREGVRAQLAGILGVDATHVALTSATTNGCNIVLAGLDLEPEDEVVTSDVEHFGLLGPLHASGATVRVARVGTRPPEEALEVIRAELTPRTRLIALSHVSYMTGNLLPIAELKESTDVPVLVDGAQSAGAVPVDARPFDFYTVSAQKWLCGPDATGALYVRDPERLRVAAPSYLSQQAYEADGSFTPRAGAARFDSLWSPVGLSGLEAALATLPEWRFERAAQIAARCREELAERVEVVTAPDQATLVTFRPRMDAADAAANAFEQDVVIRDLPGTGWVRASCGYWTSDEDVDRLVAATT
jgi:L-cysteine/cystine lyase